MSLLGQELPPVYDPNPIAEFLYLRKHVGGDDNCFPLLVFLFDETPDLVDSHWIEA